MSTWHCIALWSPIDALRILHICQDKTAAIRPVCPHHVRIKTTKMTNVPRSPLPKSGKYSFGHTARWSTIWTLIWEKYLISLKNICKNILKNIFFHISVTSLSTSIFIMMQNNRSELVKIGRITLMLEWPPKMLHCALCCLSVKICSNAH